MKAESEYVERGTSQRGEREHFIKKYVENNLQQEMVDWEGSGRYASMEKNTLIVDSWDCLGGGQEGHASHSVDIMPRLEEKISWSD